MLNQSFRQVYVSNSPAILAQGSTVASLGVGEIGILDGKTHLGLTAPTYATNKALNFVWGTPDLKYLPLMAGVPNTNIYSKLVKGKLITGWKGKAAKRGQTQVLTIGWSGDAADTNSLFAKPGERRKLFLKLTGAPIDKLYSKQGLIRQYAVDGGCSDPCGSGDCTNVDPVLLANEIVNQIQADSYVNRFVTASVLQSDAPTAATKNCYVFQVSLCDTRDDIALGIVQAQYPTDVVTRVAVSGSISTYQVTRSTNTTPSAVTNAGFVVIPNCTTCSNGYTLSNGQYVYVVKREDAGTSTALNTLKTDYSISGSETASRIVYEYGQSTYVITSTTVISAPVGVDALSSLGITRNSCVLTSPSTFAWSLTDTQISYGKLYQVTLEDSVCGTNYLTQIQAAYPNNVVTIVDPSGTCVHTYQTTVYSQCVEVGCSYANLVYTELDPFLGSAWVEVPATPSASGTLAGVRIEVAFVNRITNECTFDYFPYEQDPIHLQASSFNPDYNASPCENDWVTKQIQQFQYPVGFGAHIREEERESKSYELHERSFDPVVRQVEGYQFITNPYTYYDEYVLSFDFQYKVGGWSERYTDGYKLYFYFPEGNGATFQNAINGYVSSVGVLLDPVVLV